MRAVIRLPNLTVGMVCACAGLVMGQAVKTRPSDSPPAVMVPMNVPAGTPVKVTLDFEVRYVT